MIGPTKSYLTLAEEAFKPPTQHEKSPLRPSAAGICERALYIAYQEYLQNKPIKALTHREHRIFSLGHSIEANIIELLSENPDFKVVYKQQVVDHVLATPSSAHLLEGSLDWCLISDKHKVIMDAKSRKDRQLGQSSMWDSDITQLSQLGEIVDDNCIYIDDLYSFVKQSKDATMVKNVIQLNVYATSNFCVDRGIDHASIIRYNKNDSRWLEVRFKPNPGVLAYVLIKFSRVMQAQSIEELTGECQPGTMEQRYCPACSVTTSVVIPRGMKTVNALPATPSQAHALTKLPHNFQVLASAAAFSLASKAQDPLIQYCLDNNIHKIVIDSNTVLGLRLFKSPKEHYEFRLESNNKTKG